jgi:Skp family chaperone for outer membrane proteins
MMQVNLNKPFLVVVTIVAMFTGLLSAQAQDVSESALQVGTYDVEAVFQQHPARTELEKISQTAQAQMQAAQQEGDQEKLQQVREQFQQTRDQLVEKFYQDVDKTIPTAAEEADVKLVAAEVSYTAKDVESKDITPQLIAAFDRPEVAPDDAPEEPKSTLQVGTYDVEAVFQQHPARTELEKISQTAQAQMQAAQQEGDQQKLQQVREQFQQTRDQLVEKFYQDIDKTIPTAAEEADVKVVAAEISYTAKNVESKDITPLLIKNI